MDYLTPLQTCLLTSLLDGGIALALAYRRRLQERRVLRLVPGGAMAPKTRRLRPVEKRVVAVLVSGASMQARVRDALGELTNVFFFTSTWAELRQVVTRVSPAVIFADPLADENGNPERHLLEFTAVLHLPVILYTRIVPGMGRILLRLARYGIQHLIVHRYDDEPSRLVAAFASVAPQGSGPPLRAA